MRKSLLLGALALGFFACEQEAENITPANQPTEVKAIDEVPPHAESVYNGLIEMGYTADEIVFNDDLQAAVVEDMAFNYNHNFSPANELLGNETGKSPAAGEKTRWDGFRVAWTQSRNIKYFVETRTSGTRTKPSDAWINAFVRAAGHWSWASQNISMTRTFNRSEADLQFFNYYWPQRTNWAVAQPPSGSSPYNVGSWIVINTARAGSLDFRGSVALMAHEIGHALGYAHANQTARGTRIANTETATFHQNNPCGSIMRSTVDPCSCHNSTGRMFWNQYDRAAVDWWYEYR